jgi:hypothetical protein
MTEPIVRISRSQSWREDFIRAHNYRCHYCNRFAGSVDVGPDRKPWHVEHMEALANGGADAEENLTLACERCNSLKHTLPYANFKQYARTFFWAGEPSRIADQDLNNLMTAFLRTTDGSWFYSDSADGMVRLYALPAHELGIEAADYIAEISITGSTSRPAMGDADFIVLAHRLMPGLVAEIHLLRAEVAALRGDQQATTSAA